MYYVYLLKNKINNQIYIGSTNNLKRRLEEHNMGQHKSTKRYMPWHLVYYETYISERLSRIREKRLKYNGNAIRELKKRIGIMEDKSGAGFTFVELMIAISMMMILLVLSFPFYTSINKRLTTDRAAARLVQDFRKAIEMSMSAQKFNGNYPDGGYGIHFPSSFPEKYYLFADLDADRIYDSGELVEEIDIEGRIEITDKTDNFTSVTFLAPEPIVYLNSFSGGEPGPGTSEAYVLFSDGTNQNYIYINKAGLVYIP